MAQRFEIYRWGLLGSGVDSYENLLNFGTASKEALVAAKEGIWGECLEHIVPNEEEAAIIVNNDMNIDGVVCPSEELEDELEKLAQGLKIDGDTTDIYWRDCGEDGKVHSYAWDVLGIVS